MDMEGEYSGTSKPHHRMRCGGSIAVTGATGFVGKAVASQLREADTTVFEISLREFATTEQLSTHLALNGCKCVIHLANPLPTGKSEQQAEIEQVTVDLAATVIEAVRAQNECSLVLASTVRVYPLDAGAFTFSVEPKPFDGYGRGKLRAELLAKEIASENHPVSILRVSSVCGIFTSTTGCAQARGLAPILTRAAKMNNKIQVMGTGESTKDLIHVDDCAAAFCAAACLPPGKESDFVRCVFAGSGVPVTVKTIAVLVADKVSNSRSTQPPVEVVHTAAAPNDLAGAVDPEPAWTQLGWKPEKTLTDIVDEAIQHIVVDNKEKDRW